MTKLDRLIAELCSDGVEYITLDRVIISLKSPRLRRGKSSMSIIGISC